jgi:hypothetical protein
MAVAAADVVAAASAAHHPLGAYGSTYGGSLVALQRSTSPSRTTSPIYNVRGGAGAGVAAARGDPHAFTLSPHRVASVPRQQRSGSVGGLASPSAAARHTPPPQASPASYLALRRSSPARGFVRVSTPAERVLFASTPPRIGSPTSVVGVLRMMEGERAGDAAATRSVAALASPPRGVTHLPTLHAAPQAVPLPQSAIDALRITNAVSQPPPVAGYPQVRRGTPTRPPGVTGMARPGAPISLAGLAPSMTGLAATSALTRTPGGTAPLSAQPVSVSVSLNMGGRRPPSPRLTPLRR